MNSLAEQLGFAPEAKLLIVSCEDLGLSYATNEGIYESLRAGGATSASLMVPAPWARGAAASYRGEDVGIELTLNAEHELYRWGPITHSPSLLDGDGGFPRTVDDVWEHADLVEVRREWRAQIERAIYWGFDISYLCTHVAGVELKPEFFDVYLDLAEEFRLPLRLASIEQERRAGFPFRELATERAIVAPDRVISYEQEHFDPDDLGALLATLEPGVTEVNLRPAIDSPELRAATRDWRQRVRAHEVLTDSAQISALRNVLVIGYRALRDLMR